MQQLFIWTPASGSGVGKFIKLITTRVLYLINLLTWKKKQQQQHRGHKSHNRRYTNQARFNRITKVSSKLVEHQGFSQWSSHSSQRDQTRSHSFPPSSILIFFLHWYFPWFLFIVTYNLWPLQFFQYKVWFRLFRKFVQLFWSTSVQGFLGTKFGYDFCF